ncbi:hypothetical protein IWQ61_006086 [Dispira simplex]|nr:hypothetical protein IWQ61_006086 [Dispira simplex]
MVHGGFSLPREAFKAMASTVPPEKGGPPLFPVDRDNLEDEFGLGIRDLRVPRAAELLRFTESEFGH